MAFQKIAKLRNPAKKNVGGSSDVTQTFSRRSADLPVDIAVDVRSSGSPQSDYFLQKGFCIRSAIKSIN
jgi:hypothetical protein